MSQTKRGRNFSLSMALLAMACGPLAHAQDEAPGSEAPPSAAPISLSAARHGEELARAQAALQGSLSEESERRRALWALRDLEGPRIVSRGDGARLEVRGDEWRRRIEDSISTDAGDNRPTVSRGEADAALASLAARRQALGDWATARGGKYLQADPGDREAVLGWQRQGLIETGPPAWQEAWLSFVRWVYAILDRLMKWLAGLFRRAPGVQPAQSDGKAITFVFYMMLAGVLAGAAWLTWRALGGRLPRRRRATREAHLEGEDAALLRLPPDELLERAASFASEGNFREALRHRYLSLLLLLDARGAWSYDRRRTNWEHIARLKAAQAPRSGVDALSSLTLRFDRVRYGNESCGQDTWQSFDRDATSALDLLARASASAASGSPSEARR